MFPLLQKRLMATFVAYGNCNIFSRCRHPFLLTCPLSPLDYLLSPPSAALIMHLHVAYADRIRILCTLSILYTSMCVCELHLHVCVSVCIMSMCVCFVFVSVWIANEQNAVSALCCLCSLGLQQQQLPLF